MRIPRFWEPEEAVGEVWHDLVRGIGAEPHFPEALVPFEEARGSANLLFRALGGPAGVELLPVATDVAASRLSHRDRLAHDVGHVVHAQYDGRRLALPASIALFEDAALSRRLYRWLAAIAAFLTVPSAPPVNALQKDLATLRESLRAEQALLAACPGLRPLRAALGEALLASRPSIDLPPQEAEIEAAIRAILAQDGTSGGPLAAAIRDADFDLSALGAQEGYKPFRPVALWPLLTPPRASENAPASEDDSERPAGSAQGSEKTLRAARRKAEQADRKDSFILHRFESILSMIDFLNVNRSVDDDEEDNARKAAEDIDEVSLARNSKSAKNRLKFHLDLAPRDVDGAALVGETLYPEWDWTAGAYQPAHVRVEERLPEEAPTAPLEKPATRRRIAAVKRQFEGLRPRRRILRRQPDGFDLDLDEAVRAHCDRIASGLSDDRLHCAVRDDERDLAVSVLFDSSRSTESAVTGRPVIEIAREALVALVGGVEACGDQISVHAFSSLKRERVMVERIKDFDEKDGETVRRRIMGIAPKFYTRLGAAIRHVSAHLGRRAAARRLLLVITDGKPNDLDHYEGRRGIEDTRRAVMEARRHGQAVFAVTIDTHAQDYVPHIFGQNGFAIVPDASRLVEALPAMYRHVVT
jgi:nitric oxide reductase NorD protein